MRRSLIAIVTVLMVGSILGTHSGLTGSVFAQEGHPLTGTWAGDWNASATERSHLTVVINWNGKVLSGLLNPGPDQAALSNITLDPATWTVRFEADVKTGSGQPAHVVAEGKLEDIASYHRTLSGTWTQGPTKGSFKLTRD